MKKLLNILGAIAITSSPVIATTACQSSNANKPSQDVRYNIANFDNVNFKGLTIGLNNPARATREDVAKSATTKLLDEVIERLNVATGQDIEPQDLTVDFKIDGTKNFLTAQAVKFQIFATGNAPYITGVLDGSIEITGVNSKLSLNGYILSTEDQVLNKYDIKNVSKKNIESDLFAYVSETFEDSLMDAYSMSVQQDVNYKITSNAVDNTDLTTAPIITVTVTATDGDLMLSDAFSVKIQITGATIPAQNDINTLPLTAKNFGISVKKLEETTKTEIETAIFGDLAAVFNKLVFENFKETVTKGVDYTMSSDAAEKASYATTTVVKVTFTSEAENTKIRNSFTVMAIVIAEYNDVRTAVKEINQSDSYVANVSRSSTLDTLKSTVNSEFLFKNITEASQLILKQHQFNITGYYQADGKTAITNSNLSSYDIFNIIVTFNIDGTVIQGAATVNISVFDSGLYSTFATKLIGPKDPENISIKKGTYQIQDLINRMTKEFPSMIATWGGNYSKFTEKFMRDLENPQAEMYSYATDFKWTTKDSNTRVSYSSGNWYQFRFTFKIGEYHFMRGYWTRTA